MSIEYGSARVYILDLMSRKLPSGLAYHGLHHTRDQVLPAAELLCRHMGISSDQQLLISTAALFHDIGFVQLYQDNEAAGAEIAASVLPDFGYSKPDIYTVRKLIMATRLHHKPESVLEEILRDADLVSLGQDIFFETSMMLRREIETFLHPVPLLSWFKEQYELLSRHRYFTPAARHHFNSGKAKNLAQLELLLSCHLNIELHP